MSWRETAALLLAPDLRDVVKRLEEVDRAVEVCIRNLAETERGGHHRGLLVLEVKEDLVETRSRLGELLGILTGRSPNRG